MTERSLLVICDMWDTHWCSSVTRRLGDLAVRINDAAERARSRGVFVVHAPSDTMNFYEGHPGRERMRAMTAEVSPPERELAEPEHETTHGAACPDDPPCVPGPPWPWTRQHPDIRVADDDGVSDVGLEIYGALHQLGANRIIYAGVHADLCVLDRPFGIRQMRRWGVGCALVTDLTEAFWPEETEATLARVERYLCPTITEADIA